MELKTTYFENPGVDNTDEVLHIARKRAEELGINTILVASTTGYTAVKAMEILEGFRVIIVTHSPGFKGPNTQEFTKENRKIVDNKGGIILTTTHAFGGLSRSMRQGDIPEARRTYVVGDMVAMTLRVFGQGMKVVCEIAVMAADSGLVLTDEDVIAVAGTGAGTGGRGADTAVVIQPANAQFFFQLAVREILCKPLTPHRY